VKQSTCVVVKIVSVTAAVVGWVSEAVLLALTPRDTLAWVVASATLAGVGSVGLLLSLVYVSPTRAYQLGYDVGWRDGRRAERMSAHDQRPGIVTRLPTPAAQMHG
jgi:hypothetical protein